MRGAATTTDMVSMGVTGDSVDRFVANADGKLEWGPGNAALDTSIYRSAVFGLVLQGVNGNILLDLVGSADVALSGVFDGSNWVATFGNTGGFKFSQKTAVVGGFVVGAAAIATTATTGFFYAPSCAGTPTGTPVTETGTVPMVVDTTGSKLWAYIGGAWKAVTLT